MITDRSNPIFSAKATVMVIITDRTAPEIKPNVKTVFFMTTSPD
jgi:hypothetical protein